ncbi:hypothetical protein SBV1_430001 [Verrucomicrobia bacterium]|nr:hypothetical protein SBV1_430001 [Verrucomicrobiota bacterium]
MANSQFSHLTPLGYDALIARFSLQVIPHWHHSRTSQSTTHETHTDAGQVVEVYPTTWRAPGRLQILRVAAPPEMEQMRIRPFRCDPLPLDLRQGIP